MLRCDTCGRSLVGERADHPTICKLIRVMGRLPAANRQRRIVLREGDAQTDPFMERFEMSEGPIQRGA